MSEQHNHELCPNTTIVKNLRSEVERLRDENTMLRDKSIESEQRTIRIFEILNTISDSVKDINTTIATMLQKPDSFKIELYKFGLELGKLGVIGGIIYMVLQGKIW